VKNDNQYEGLREQDMSKSRAAAISNSEGSSSRAGKSSSQSRRSSGSGSGGNRAQKAAAGRRRKEIGRQAQRHVGGPQSRLAGRAAEPPRLAVATHLHLSAARYPDGPAPGDALTPEGRSSLILRRA
jgi:hypothetical protein